MVLVGNLIWEPRGLPCASGSIVPWPTRAGAPFGGVRRHAFSGTREAGCRSSGFNEVRPSAGT